VPRIAADGRTRGPRSIRCPARRSTPFIFGEKSGRLGRSGPSSCRSIHRLCRSAPNKRNQFGFLLSGPVYLPKLYNGKDRTFFTFSWEWQGQRNGTTSTALVPTAQERTADFSATAGTIVDPLTKTSRTIRWGPPHGNYTFTGVYSSPPPVGTPTRQAAIADTLLGFPATYAVQTTPYEQRLRYTNFATYLQDDWRATPNLTFNIGLRWEYFGKPYDLFDRIASFDLSTGQQLLAGQNGTPRSLINPDRNNFGPRIGFAWRALGTESLVIRGAYGVFFSPPIGNDFRSRGFQDPFAFLVTRTYRPAIPTSPLPEFTADDPLAGANRQTNLTRSGVDRNLRDAYVQQWNLSIQKLVTANTSWEVAFRGSKSTRLQTNLH